MTGKIFNAIDGACFAGEVIQLLRNRKGSLALAESCTGGLIAKWITDVPGASEVFRGGVVSYANSAKRDLLGVSETTLERFGAVSEQCAGEMVHGATTCLHADCAIAVTGIAGPGGGTPLKPVGLVYIAVQCFDRIRITENHFQGTREQVREQTAATGLQILSGMLRENMAS